MNFKQAKINGLDILKDSTSGIYYTQKDWRRLTYRDETQPNSGYHGARTSPLFASTRVITLQGIIDRLGNTRELEATSHLETIFSLQSNTSTIIPKVLYIKDMYDREWTLDVKVKTPIEFVEYDDSITGIAWKWSVTLESVTDPIYKSATESSVDGIESTFGGFNFPITMPFAMSKYYNVIECTSFSGDATPARIEITAINNISSPLKIQNITDGTFFALDISAVSGDIIIVDSNDLTATKNGVNILANRIAGSVFPTIAQFTQFSVTDLDGGIPSNDFTIKILFSDALL